MSKNYAPKTKEECLQDLYNLKSNFDKTIDGFKWEYTKIKSLYSNLQLLNHFRQIGMINPYMDNEETQIEMLSMTILGYTAVTFEILQNSLKFWTESEGYKKFKNMGYYQYGIGMMYKLDLISKKEKKIFDNFRPSRNTYVHFGQPIFCDYIFIHQSLLSNLIATIYDLLSFNSTNTGTIRVLPNSSTHERLLEDMDKILNNSFQSSVV